MQGRLIYDLNGIKHGKKFNNSFKLNEVQLEQLRQIIPEAFKDGFVDIGALSDTEVSTNWQSAGILHLLFVLGKTNSQKQVIPTGNE